jgi:hypothetical protein
MAGRGRTNKIEVQGNFTDEQGEFPPGYHLYTSFSILRLLVGDSSAPPRNDNWI